MGKYLAQAIKSLYPGADLDPDTGNVELRDNGLGPFIHRWDLIEPVPNPTDQAIVDEELQVARALKIKEVAFEGLRRANLVYDDEVFPSIGAIKYLIDIDNTYTRAGAPAARLVAVNQLLTDFENARDAINLLDQAGVAVYDVVNDPGWSS